MPSDGLTWIVPCRRAVVRRAGLYYRDLVGHWLDALHQHGGRLLDWYDLDATDYEGALLEVDDFLRAWLEGDPPIPVSREDENVIDGFGARFWVRLWKGPLRVLLEEQQRPEPADDARVLDQGSTTDPPLDLHPGTCEVLNPDAEFMMGDVVEFPLFKFLAAAGLSRYGSAPTYDDVLSFDPNGSFLLGDSVTDAGGHPPDPPLPDNRVAMRFQNLLNTYIGAFYSLEPVFRPSDVGPRGEAAGHTVYSRGMIYAATLSRPTSEPGQWKVRNYHWCGNSKGKIPRCLPTRAGLDRLAPGLPVTPGSVCSDTALLLLNYMIRNHSGSWGKGSVGRTMKKIEDAGLHDAYEYVPAKDLTDRVPEVSVEQVESALMSLVPALDPFVEDLAKGSYFIEELLLEAQQQPAWMELRKSKRDKLAEYARVRYPRPFMRLVADQMKSSKTTDAARALLSSLHHQVVTRTIELRDGLQEIFESDDWSMCAAIKADHGGNCLEWHATMSGLTACTEGCDESHEQAFYALYKLEYHLRYKHKELRRIYELEPEARLRKLNKTVGGTRMAVMDMGQFMSDLNVVTLSGHEWCVVRQWPFDRLFDSLQIPVAGHMAGYHPLTGEPFGAPGGTFYVFEETGTLKRIDVSDDEKYRLLGAGPFKWKVVPGNQCMIKVHGSKVSFGEGSSVRSKRLSGITRLRGTEGLEVLQQRHGPYEVARPLYIHPVTRAAADADDKQALATGKERLVEHGDRLYASRSVPLPTIGETRGAFVDTDRAAGELDRLIQRLREANKTAGPTLRSKIATALELLSKTAA